MNLKGLKTSTGVQKIMTNLIISEELTETKKNYLKLELNDGSKAFINIWSNDANYLTYKTLGLNKLLLAEIDIEYLGKNGAGYDEYKIQNIVLKERPSLTDCVDIDRLKDELRNIIMGINDNELKNLLFAMCQYQNQELLQKLFAAPCTEKSAYSFSGGTLAHIIRLCRLCDAVTSVYDGWDFNKDNFNERLNSDLLKTIAIFHDISKAEKYLIENEEISKTFEGELLRDSIISNDIFNEIVQIPNINLSKEKKIIIQNAITMEDSAMSNPTKSKEAGVFFRLEQIDVLMGNFEFMSRTSIGNEFQRLFDKQYITTDFDNL